MEGHKHFSHTHSLNNYQVPQGIEVIICSGCKLTASGTIYACLQCKFYLHENCFRATRSLQHPSHPSHPLNLFPYPTYPSNSFYCKICNLIGTGFSYSCSNCEFDIHIHCAYNTNSSHLNRSRPNQIPDFNFLTPDAPARHNPTVDPFQNQEIHDLLPSHPATLHSTPPYKYSESTSSTCQSDLNALCSSVAELAEMVKDLRNPVAPNDRKEFDFGTYVEQVESEASAVQDHLGRLAAAELRTKMMKRHYEDILEMWDPPGTKYKYRYF